MRQQIYLTIVNNGAYLPNQSDVLAQMKDWIFRKTPFEAIIHQKDISLPIQLSETNANGISYNVLSEITRKNIVNEVSDDMCEMIFHIHPKTSKIADGLSFRNLINGMCISDISGDSLDTPNNAYRNLTHEFIHNLWTFLYWWGNIPLENDTMDTYYKDDEVEAPDGNRETNLARITPKMWNILCGRIEKNTLKYFLNYAIFLAMQLLNSILNKAKAEEKIKEFTSPKDNMNEKTNEQIIEERLTVWANCGKAMEGYFAPCPQYPKGTPSWRNNNPGNLKYGSFTKDFPYKKVLPSGFLVFASYEDGFNSLKQFFKNACEGKYTPRYTSDMTLQQFYEKYAPKADGNDPIQYAKFVADAIKMSITDKISSIVSYQQSS